jgi:hypothetical protein
LLAAAALVAGDIARTPAFAASMWHSPFTSRRTVLSPYGKRDHPITGEERMHEGLDFAAPSGTGLHAVSAGVVAFAGRSGNYGNQVRVDHGDGHVTSYSHMLDGSLAVRTGDQVRLGTRIGSVGSTGASTGPHLHLELIRNGVKVDPGPFFANAPLNPGQPTTPPSEDDLPYSEAQLKLIVREAMIGILRAEEFNKDTVAKHTANTVWDFTRDDMPGKAWQTIRDARMIARRAEEQSIAANAKLDAIMRKLGA